MNNMKKTLFLYILTAYAGAISAQTKESAVINEYYNNLRSSFNEKNALQTTAFVEKYWRLAGNTGFNQTVFHIEKILQSAGFVKEVNQEKEAALTYRIETRKMRKPTWEPVSSSLTIVGQTAALLQSTTNRNMIAINSASTPENGETAEIIYVGKGTRNDFEGKDLKGKIVFGEASASSLYNNAIKKGAIGVLSYSMPKYTQPEKYTNSIQFQSIPYQDTTIHKWAIILSFQAKEKLKAALANGPVQVNVKVASKIYPSEELTIVANVRGNSHPDERFVFSAHIQEPGANDNASGVGTLAEMARTTAAMIAQKKYQPERSITFLWGDEIVSTARYIKDDSVRARGILWGLSLDMVGEDIAKTGGSFLIEKMPDPSAIWTRGNDHHSEWGGSVLQESDMFPHYFNDFIINRCRQQATENNWIINANPFEGGSDHTPFLQAKIPGLLMWHFTDAFYHTDADRIEMVSAAEMRNVGISALATAFTLCAADESTVLLLMDEFMKSAAERLKTEFDLSKAAIKSGAKIQDEQHIVQVWASWYKKALSKMKEINIGGKT
ncbi:MAG: hypothetical protein RLZZ28_269, partial [Bacteroidota bacterium]